VILQKTWETTLKEIDTMTVTTSIDPALPWAEQIDRAEPDLLRALLKTFVEALMGAEADAMCLDEARLLGAATSILPQPRSPAPPREPDGGPGPRRMREGRPSPTTEGRDRPVRE